MADWDKNGIRHGRIDPLNSLADRLERPVIFAAGDMVQSRQLG